MEPPVNCTPKYNYLFRGGPPCYICGNDSYEKQFSLIYTAQTTSEAFEVDAAYCSTGSVVEVK